MRTMKSLVALLPIAMGLFGQEKMKVDPNDLPPELRQTLERRAMLKKFQTELQEYGRLAQATDQISIAMTSGLDELTDGSIKFSKTKAGRIAMSIVTLYVLGEKVGRLFLGLLMTLFLLFVTAYTWRRNCMSRDIVIEERTRKWGLFPLKSPAKYEEYKPADISSKGSRDWTADGVDWYRFLVVVVGCVLTALFGLRLMF